MFVYLPAGVVQMPLYMSLHLKLVLILIFLCKGYQSLSIGIINYVFAFSSCDVLVYCVPIYLQLCVSHNHLGIIFSSDCKTKKPTLYLLVVSRPLAILLFGFVLCGIPVVRSYPFCSGFWNNNRLKYRQRRQE